MAVGKGVFFQADATDELLRAIQNGSSGAFVKLSDMYNPLIVKEVFRYEGTLGTADLDDLRQAALISLYRAAVSYRFDKGVTFGLYAKICIVNGIADTLRYFGKKICDVCIDELDEDDAPASEDNPQSLMLDKESASVLDKRIKGALSPLESRIFDLYLEGYSYAEIAEQLGKTPKSVDNALRRVKEKLKKLF